MTQAKKHFLTLLLTLTIAVASKAQIAKDIVGQWKDNELPNRLVEFYQGKKGLYYARIVRDADNESLNGKVFIKELQFEETTKTYNGVVSPPDIKADIEIKTVISWIDNDTLQIVVKNFFQTKKIHFSRVITK